MDVFGVCVLYGYLSMTYLINIRMYVYVHDSQTNESKFFKYVHIYVYKIEFSMYFYLIEYIILQVELCIW